MAYAVLSAETWAQEQFGKTNLGDKRLNQRVLKVAAAMANNPAGSIPQQQGQWGQTKGAYRLFDHPKATFQSLSVAHWQQTRQQCLQHPLVLLIQDTTWVDYSAYPATTGLGWHGRSKDRPHGGKGLMMHGVLAVAPVASASGDVLGQVLGLAHNKLWTRTGKPKNSTQKECSARRRADDRESLRWRDAVSEVGGAAPGGSYLHVGDREGDFFELFEQTRQLPGVGFLVRINHDRNVLEGHDTPQTLKLEQRKGSSLKRLLRDQPALGEKRLWRAPCSGQAGRWATVKVSATPVTIYSPQIQRKGRALRCWAVRVWEPEGAEAVEWMLLTSMPVNTLCDALRTAEYYSLRWLIEEYHKCLKSGCRVEERQLESVERLGPLIGMLSVVAVRLLKLKNDARIHPDKLAEKCVPRPLVRTLGLLIQADPATMTVRSFIHEVAKRGGFLGRKSDGEPGYLTLWRGWQELEQVHLGYQLARQDEDVGNA